MLCAPADFRTGGLVSALGTEVLRLAHVQTSVPERVKGISGRQGRLRRRCRGLHSLTAVFRVSVSHHTPGSEPSFDTYVEGSIQSYRSNEKRPVRGVFIGAGEGNRTLDVSLGSSSFAIKLHPHFSVLFVHWYCNISGG